MSPSPEASELQNGAETEPEAVSAPPPDPEPEAEQVPEVEPQRATAAGDEDRRVEEEPTKEEAAIQSNRVEEFRSNDEKAHPKEQGNRTFTMRELLSELKTEEGEDAGTPYSQDSLQVEQNNAAMELISSVTGVDEEGRSRQRILTFAAKRYSFTFL
uniref:Uncharacterized protein MANES_01G051700 n=1 Tax=Rhizophora mucronata TaxID=61149 RepID=A0A2P2K5H6_RHIMU